MSSLDWNSFCARKWFISYSTFWTMKQQTLCALLKPWTYRTNNSNRSKNNACQNKQDKVLALVCITASRCHLKFTQDDPFTAPKEGTIWNLSIIPNKVVRSWLNSHWDTRTGIKINQFSGDRIEITKWCRYWLPNFVPQTLLCKLTYFCIGSGRKFNQCTSCQLPLCTCPRTSNFRQP